MTIYSCLSSVSTTRYFDDTFQNCFIRNDFELWISLLDINAVLDGSFPSHRGFFVPRDHEAHQHLEETSGIEAYHREFVLGLTNLGRETRKQDVRAAAMQVRAIARILISLSSWKRAC